MNKINKSFEFSNLQKVDKGYTAIVSAYTVKDSYGDRIEFGAFGNSIKKIKDRNGSIPVLFQHTNELSTVIGKTTYIEELKPGDDRLPERIRGVGGLYVEFDFYTEFEEGKKAQQLLLDGVYQEFSVGMYLVNYEIVNDSFEDYEAIIREADLVEYSMVLRGANPYTELISVKAYAEKVGRELSNANLSTLKDSVSKLDEVSKSINGIIERVETPKEEENKDNKQRRAKLLLARTKHNIRGYINEPND